MIKNIEFSVVTEFKIPFLEFKLDLEFKILRINTVVYYFKKLACLDELVFYKVRVMWPRILNEQIKASE
jgi:hypothetical protein